MLHDFKSGMKFFTPLIIGILSCFSSFGQSGVDLADTAHISALKKRSANFSGLALYDSVIACERKLKVLYSAKHQWNKALKCQVEICSNLLMKMAYEELQASIQEGMKLVEEHLPGDAYTLYELNNLSGVLFYERGDYEKAITHLKRSLSYQGASRASSDIGIQAALYNNIAAITSRMGDYDEAIYYYEKNIDLLNRQIHTKDNLLQLGEGYNNLSVSYYRKKMFREALTFQEKYLEILNQIGGDSPVNDYILCYNSLGIYYFELKEYRKSLDVLNKALELSRSSDYFIEKIYHNLGYVYRMLENDEMALYFLNLALDKNKQKFSKGHPDIGKEYRHLGVIHARRGETKKALQYYQKAFTFLADNFSDSSIFENPPLTKIRSKPDMLRTLRDKATALRELSIQKGDSTLMNVSLKTYLRAMTLAEQMRDEYESEAARQFINEEAQPLYAGALETIYSLQRKNSVALLTQAFETIEKSKALLLNESLQRKKNADSFGVPDSLLVKERRIKTAISFYEKQLTDVNIKGDADLTALHTSYLRSYQDKSRQLQETFEKYFPNYFSMRNRFSITSLDKLKHFLKDEKGCLVEYFLSDEKIWILVVSPSHTSFIEKRKPPMFDEWVASYERCLKDFSFITNFSRKAYDVYRHSAHELYRFLLSDVMKLTESDHRLLIVPHNELSYLPFESLLTNPAPAVFKGYAELDYLIKKRRISYTYSGSLHMELVSKRKRISPDCIAFGVSFLKNNSHSGLSALPHTKVEMEAIRDVFDGSFFYDSKATKETFRERSGQFGIIHLATHSVMDEQTPGNSKIYFAPSDASGGNALYAYEIANLSLNAELVVLSACETGSGKLARGEGVMSIGRSFIYAGSNSVLMNLWKSEDKSNASLVSAFYALLADGESKISSLHQAKLKYLRNADEFKAHPLFWAGYVLVGHEGEISEETPFLLFVVLGVCVTVSLSWIGMKGKNIFRRSQVAA